ncbi:MAG: zinc-binding alcohol dehydrogenase family protein [Deinococcales bacterium]
MMKAVLVHEMGEAEVLTYQDYPQPQPKAHEVLIKTSYTSVNFADIKSRQGGYGEQKLPFIPGLDAVGRVEALGEAVKGWQEGDRIAAYTSGGSYAEYVLADTALSFKVPDAVSDAQAAGIGIIITAYNIIAHAAHLQQGESILIHAGAGGVGSTAIQIAKALAQARFTPLWVVSLKKLLL